MCGILGYINYSKNSLGPQEASIIKNALDLMSHRGPNHTGLSQNENWVLGHKRLSIIDLSPNGNQPFVDDSGRYILTYNGEIFNFQELKNKYLAKNFKLKSNTDTEILLNILISKGAEIIPELNGFFAFAFFDRKNKSFILARDQFGIKPLYFYKIDDVFCFSSELRPLSAIFKGKLTLCLSALEQYLSLSYIPNPLTLFNEIQKIPPGHILQINQYSLTQTRYYKFPQNQNLLSTSNDLKDTIIKSIDYRLNADVNCGVFLSGGIDSSIVVAIASQLKKNLKTFSIGFKNNSFDDETKYSRIIAEKFKTDHHEFIMDDTNILETIHAVLNTLDEPFADTSAIPTFFLCSKAKKFATVFLSGDGADELFAGYNKHLALYFSLKYPKLVMAINSLLKLIPEGGSSRESLLSNLKRQKEKFKGLSGKSEFEQYVHLCLFSPVDICQKILKQSINSKWPNDLPRQLELYQDLKDNFNHVLENDMKLVLSGDMLPKIDMMSMANSIEVRPIFLDLNLVNMAFQIPASAKIDINHRKKILINTFKSDLPPQITQRPKKGFSISIGSYMGLQMKNSIEKIFNKNKINDQGLFQFEVINNIFSLDYRSTDRQQLKWALLVLQNWLDKHYFI